MNFVLLVPIVLHAIRLIGSDNVQNFLIWFARPRHFTPYPPSAALLFSLHRRRTALRFKRKVLTSDPIDVCVCFLQDARSAKIIRTSIARVWSIYGPVRNFENA